MELAGALGVWQLQRFLACRTTDNTAVKCPASLDPQIVGLLNASMFGRVRVDWVGTCGAVGCEFVDDEADLRGLKSILGVGSAWEGAGGA